MAKAKPTRVHIWSVTIWNPPCGGGPSGFNDMPNPYTKLYATDSHCIHKLEEAVVLDYGEQYRDAIQWGKAECLGKVDVYC